MSDTKSTPFDVLSDNESFVDDDILAISNAEENSNFISDGSDEENGLCEELRRDFVDENIGDCYSLGSSRAIHHNRESVMLTNSSLMIIRLWGKYLHLMKVLSPVAVNVFSSMAQLLDYYTLSVYDYFTRNQVVQQINLNRVLLYM